MNFFKNLWIERLGFLELWITLKFLTKFESECLLWKILIFLKSIFKIFLKIFFKISPLKNLIINNTSRHPCHSQGALLNLNFFSLDSCYEKTMYGFFIGIINILSIVFPLVRLAKLQRKNIKFSLLIFCLRKKEIKKCWTSRRLRSLSETFWDLLEIAEVSEAMVENETEIINSRIRTLRKSSTLRHGGTTRSIITQPFMIVRWMYMGFHVMNIINYLE